MTHRNNTKFDIVYEDDDIIVVNKPAGLSCSPARGEENLLELLRGRVQSSRFKVQSPEDEDLPRMNADEREPSPPSPIQNLKSKIQNIEPAEEEELTEEEEDEPAEGSPAFMLHRLDRPTSGVVIYTKHAAAHRILSKQFERRSVEKEYLALVWGEMAENTGIVELPIGAAGKANKMKVDHQNGKPSVTEFEVSERFKKATLLLVKPRTGRTHQIRVHLAAIGHPLLADRLYGGELPLLSQFKRGYRFKEGEEERPLIGRPMLHARRISLVHPSSGEERTFEAPLPRDFETVLRALRKYAKR